jgi:hypothetical protein
MSEAPVDAASAAHAVAVAPKSVLVVDDELAGLTFAHLSAWVAGAAGFFADVNSPEAEEAWSLAVAIKGKRPLGETAAEEAADFLASDEFVRDVLLSQHFYDHATPVLKGPLANFLAHADSVRTLKQQVEEAFPSPGFVTTFVADRPPAPSDLMGYDLLVLDLVLRDSAAAIDELVQYLKKMGDDSYPQELPCIVVMSGSPELISESLRFSTESNISAAGLLLLPKPDIADKEFGTAGLKLSYQQLDRQREAAQRIRAFMREWIGTLESAQEKASKTLWNLDAAAMQEIHLSAFLDNDPFDEHLNDLVVREFLWHVESVPLVGKAIEELDDCFQKQFKPGSDPVVIGQRFIAPRLNAQAARDLVAHFTATGSSVPASLAASDATEAAKRFNRLVPFGAVLAPADLKNGAECLVHITQQCDLNSATRPLRDGTFKPVSAIFAFVQVVEVSDRNTPDHKTEDLVARGLSINGGQYDLKLVRGRQLAMPIPAFIKLAQEQGLNVVARLRHDIANQFLVATANFMTRFASLRTTRVEVLKARVYLHGKQLPGGAPLALPDPNTGQAAEILVSRHGKLHYFRDDTSLRIALWITRTLGTHYGATDFDTERTWNSLSCGLNNNDLINRPVHFAAKVFPFADLDAQLTSASAPDPKVHLVVVSEP